MTDLMDRVLMLARVDAFGQLATEQLALIASVCCVEDRSAGEMIYGAGDVATAMYVVRRGRVALQSGASVLAEVGAGQDFGTWALFDPEPRVTAAQAMATSRLLRLGAPRSSEPSTSTRIWLGQSCARSLVACELSVR